MAKTSLNKTQGFEGDADYAPSISDKYMELVTTPELSSPAEIQANIIARILESDDFDAALGGIGGIDVIERVLHRSCGKDGQGLFVGRYGW